MNTCPPVFIGSILLEPNRWASGKIPSYRVSEWVDRFRDAGFDGIELWEHHATMVPAAELAALTEGSFPIAIYNAYSSFDPDGAESRCFSALMARHLRAAGVKYNVGNDPSRRDVYLASVRDWAERLPDHVRVLCECHPGTLVEDPHVAVAFFAELAEPRFQCICHPFSVPLAKLEAWLAAVGPRTTHLHVQLRDHAGSIRRLDADPVYARDVIQLLRSYGFAGTLTIEFTEGTGTPDENRNALWESAVRDLAFVRENWT